MVTQTAYNDELEQYFSNIYKKSPFSLQPPQSKVEQY
jgi:hypothetical protein